MLTEKISGVTVGYWRDYLALCKLRVVAMMLMTVVVGMLIAAPQLPSVELILATLIGIGACASSAAAINHLLDRHIDAKMDRTKHRPLVSGKLNGVQVMLFAGGLAVIGFFILNVWVNSLTAWLTLLTLIGYAGIYTGFLKRVTSQNIVIGGLAGAAPPLLGWTAISNSLDPAAFLLVLIIFTWTPPHFWALAIYRYEEYQQINIPMFPAMYGIALTKKMIFLYTLLLSMVSELPFLVGMNHALYAVGTGLLNGYFIFGSWKLLRTHDRKSALNVFRYSIWYLLCIFLLMVIDHECTI